MKIIKLIIKYLIYKQKSVTKYKIHSPFVFEFIEKVLHDQSLYEDYGKVDKIRTSLHKITGVLNSSILELGLKLIHTPPIYEKLKR